MTSLEAILRERIRNHGPVTFAAFMETALYHPEHGYYSGESPVGPGGDFVTAVHHPGFARCLARQAAGVWTRLGEPDPFHVVELGAASGRLARDLQRELGDESPELAERARYVAVEAGRGHRSALEEAGFHAVERLEHLEGPVTGLVFGNEVLDALPVHVVRWSDGALRERYVTWEEGTGFVWTSGPPSTPRLEEVLEADGITLEEDQEVTVGLAALDLLGETLDHVDAGVALFLDYADEAQALYHPSRGNTLRSFQDHRVTGDVLADPGARDLTATVDLTALRRRAEAAGAEVAVTTQGRFLLALGILEVHRELGPLHGAGVKNLVVPGGMGEAFKALAAGRGVDPAALRGFQDPFGTPAWLDE